jgi:phage terminase large subunit-like protein
VFDKAKYPFCYDGHKYALDVMDGTIPVSKFVLGAVKRYLEDIETAKDENNWYYFNPDRAERFLKLVQKFKHVKGVWDDPHIHYEPWENFIFMNVYGFINKKTDSRRFRTVYIEVPRGNGKSLLASQVGLYHLVLENPVGNEVYSAATGREQARIILDSSRAMARANKDFMKATGTEVQAHSIIHRKSNSYFKALSSDGKTLDGLQPACALIDELHSHKTDEVYNVIESAMAKRRDSLLFIITTAGFDTTGIGYAQSAYNKKICLGEVNNDQQFAIVYTIDDDDDPYNPISWEKANPNWGVSVDPDRIEATAKKSKVDASTKNNFLVKHLNTWLDASQPFFDKQRWLEHGNRDLKIEDFYGEPCYVGIDLASKIDICSFAFVFNKNDKYQVFTYNFCPKETIKKSKNSNYEKWVEQNDLISTLGEAINFNKLEAVFVDKANMVKMTAGHYDPWNATQFAQNLITKFFEMVEFRMNTANLSEPMKELDALIRKNEIEHCGNEVTSWCIGNVVAKYDQNDNVFPRKDNNDLKIDPVIAIIMALAGWIQEEDSKSVYEERDLIFL